MQIGAVGPGSTAAFQAWADMISASGVMLAPRDQWPSKCKVNVVASSRFSRAVPRLGSA